MATVGVTELKAQLAKYLRLAKRGVEVQVLERGVPVARLVGVVRAEDSENADEQALDRMVAAGLVKRGTGDIRKLIGRQVKADADVVRAIDEDREERF